MAQLVSPSNSTISRVGATAHRPIVALIPAYNEQRFIGSIVLAARAYVDEVVVVDDGSKDQTAQIAHQAGATVIRQHENKGKAAAVNTGFEYLRGRTPTAVVMLDGDGQHMAEEIPIVLAPVLNDNADVVIGSRFRETKSDIPAYRQIGQHGLTMVTNLSSGVFVSDSQSGFRAFSGEALDRLFFSQGGFSLESEMQFLAGEHGLRIAEVPISVIYAEKAKRNPFQHGMQVINGILQLMGQIRPLLFFGMMGMAVLALGILLGLYTIDIYQRTHELAVGYGMVTVLLSVIGVVLLFAGVILHSTRGMFLSFRQSILERMADSQAQADFTIVPKDPSQGAKKHLSL
ncbi:glycosyltransferase family 2 protein [Chloroflexia bacterium SDU3-3]|nr:glycosyltransferase family 2 protein [Chloroflexia bacterium SDU3-3]